MPIAEISVAFSACSVDRSTVWPSSLTAQASGSGRGPEPRQNATPTPTTTARTTKKTRVRNLMQRSWSVAVQCGVQADAVAVPGLGLDRAGDRVAAEEHVVGAGELAGLDHLGLGVDVLDRDLGAGRDVAAGLHHAVVAERDADAGV